MHSHYMNPCNDGCRNTSRPICCAPFVVSPCYALTRCELMRREPCCVWDPCDCVCPPPCPPQVPNSSCCVEVRQECQLKEEVRFSFCLPCRSEILRVCLDIVDVCQRRCALQVCMRMTVYYVDSCGCECKLCREFVRRIALPCWFWKRCPVVELAGQPEVCCQGGRWLLKACLLVN